MKRKIQAFFENENDALSTTAKLETLKISEIKLDRIPESTNYIPLLPATQFEMVSGSLKRSAHGVLPNLKPRTNKESMSFILEFEVREEDFHEAFLLLQKSDAFLDENFF
ncbi:hypothetical protein [Evansella tamaricis]|uniref:RNA polymerase alpha subunit n=1 Tax=Evansella tamaricis TaxID=2069301 RepID=A0ABS6JJI1_9BACI|nr:hypothetical protein [Evansella tamaricis]MBU9713817.1 hypothetical protein [Evansella tamaricis]